MAPLSVRSLAQLAHGRTAVYDHRGFVVRTRPVADLAAVLDAEGLDRVIVTGTSYGSYIAAAFAVTHPHRLAGLVLDSATLAPMLHRLQSRETQQISRHVMEFDLWSPSPATGTAHWTRGPRCCWTRSARSPTAPTCSSPVAHGTWAAPPP